MVTQESVWIDTGDESSTTARSLAQVASGALTPWAAKPFLQGCQGVQCGIVGITTADLQIVLAIGILDRREDVTVPSGIPRFVDQAWHATQAGDIGNVQLHQHNGAGVYGDLQRTG